MQSKFCFCNDNVLVRFKEKMSQLINSEVELRKSKSKSSPSWDILSGSQAEVEVTLEKITEFLISDMNRTVVWRVWGIVEKRRIKLMIKFGNHRNIINFKPNFWPEWFKKIMISKDIWDLAHAAHGVEVESRKSDLFWTLQREKFLKSVYFGLGWRRTPANIRRTVASSFLTIFYTCQ